MLASGELTRFVDLSAGREEERLATDEEKKRGVIAPDLLNKSPAELQRRFRKEFPDLARRAAKQAQGLANYAGALQGAGREAATGPDAPRLRGSRRPGQK